MTAPKKPAPLTTRQLRIKELLEHAEQNRMGGYHIDSISSKLTIAGGSVSLREDMKELEAREIAEQYKARIGGTVLWRIRREKPTAKESLFS